jgi:hypothetical protein
VGYPRTSAPEPEYDNRIMGANATNVEANATIMRAKKEKKNSRKRTDSQKK